MAAFEYNMDVVAKYMDKSFTQQRDQGLAEGFARGFVEGFAQGLIETKRQDVLKALDLRRLQPTEEQRARVGASTDLAKLDRWFERSQTTTSAAEVFID